MLKYFHTSRRNLVLMKMIAYIHVNGSTNQPNPLMLMLCRSAKPHHLRILKLHMLKCMALSFHMIVSNY